MEFVSESLILSHTKFLKNAAVESLWGAGASCIVLGNPHMIIFLQSNKFVWPIIWIGKSQRRRCYLAVMFWDTAAAARNPHIIICLQFHNIDLKSEVESLRSADAAVLFWDAAAAADLEKVRPQLLSPILLASSEHGCSNCDNTWFLCISLSVCLHLECHNFPLEALLASKTDATSVSVCLCVPLSVCLCLGCHNLLKTYHLP